MSYAAIGAAFDTYLGTLSVGVDVIFEGQPYMPTSGRPYITSQLSAYSRVNAGMGVSSAMLEQGAYTLMVRRPAVDGRLATAMLADRMIESFPRGAALVTGGGQKVIVTYASAQPALIDAEWIAVPVVVQWFATDP